MVNESGHVEGVSWPTRRCGGASVSTSTTGRVLRGVGGLPWVGLRLTVTDLSAVLADFLLTSQITDADGRFTLVYGADGTLGLPARRLLVQVTDRAGRELAR